MEFCSYHFWSFLEFPKGVRFIDGVEELFGEACFKYLIWDPCVLCGLFGESVTIAFLRIKNIRWIRS